MTTKITAGQTFTINECYDILADMYRAYMQLRLNFRVLRPEGWDDDRQTKTTAKWNLGISRDVTPDSLYAAMVGALEIIEKEIHDIPELLEHYAIARGETFSDEGGDDDGTSLR